MIDPRTAFSEEEIRRILARAADREAEGERARLGAGTGLTLGGLKEVATDAGLDPLHVEAAAREVLLHRAAVPERTRLGLPVELLAQRVIPGPVSDAQWERMVAGFRDVFRKSGIVSQFGEVREWVSGNESTEGMPVRIRLEPVDEGTLVTLQQPTRSLSVTTYALGGTFSFFALLFGALFVAGDFAPAVATLPILMAVLGVVSFVGGWAGWRAWVPRQEERFRAVLDRVELIGRGG